VLEIDGFFAFVVFGLWLYCIYDVITTDDVHVRNLPKMVWLFVVIFLFDIGALAWLLLGRPQNWQFARPPQSRRADASESPTEAASGTASPLSDADLDGLSPIVREREESARMKLWEEQLKRREDAIRQRELGLRRPDDEEPSS
jgi:hypothetical protein